MIGDAVINDGPGLLLIVEKQPDGNTLQVTRDVEAALEALKPGMPDVAIDSTIFRPATFIEMSLENLNRALLIGCLLLVLIVELLNSAVEAAVDRISIENHRLAKRAKDIGSAAVMLSIVNAVIIWLLILLS